MPVEEAVETGRKTLTRVRKFVHAARVKPVARPVCTAIVKNALTKRLAVDLPLRCI